MVQNISILSVSQTGAFVNKLLIRLELRQKIFNANKALENQIKALKSKVDHNRKKYKESERQTKYDRIAKLQENLRILTQMYNEQNDEIKK